MVGLGVPAQLWKHNFVRNPSVLEVRRGCMHRIRPGSLSLQPHTRQVSVRETFPRLRKSSRFRDVWDRDPTLLYGASDVVLVLFSSYYKSEAPIQLSMQGHTMWCGSFITRCCHRYLTPFPPVGNPRARFPPGEQLKLVVS
jgi:hypothetical protein